jgi:glyoxylase-like metal-dependent hydrolase (beta-lactamase superfamily II)
MGLRPDHAWMKMRFGYSRPVQWPEGSRESFKPLDYTGYSAVAPGVVLIKAPGHTPGSQIIYV